MYMVDYLEDWYSHHQCTSSSSMACLKNRKRNANTFHYSGDAPLTFCYGAPQKTTGFFKRGSLCFLLQIKISPFPTPIPRKGASNSKLLSL